MNKLSENLKALRKQNNLTQADVAQYLNISRAGYTKYESQNGEPSIDNLINLAEFFKVSIDYLVGREFNTKSDIEAIIMQKRIDKEVKEVSQEIIDKFIRDHTDEIKELIINRIKS